MAIIIPSKNIYEINNQKVVDNEVDNIEVVVKNITPDNSYSEPVYNESVSSGIYKPEIENISDQKAGIGSNIVAGSSSNPIVGIYAAFLYADSFYYIDKTIEIPIQNDISHIIQSIIVGLDNNGEKNIKYTCGGKINTGNSNASVFVSIQTNGVAVESYSSTLIPPIGDRAYEQTITKNGNFTISREETERYVITTDGQEYIEAHIVFPQEDNLETLVPYTFEKDGKEYFGLQITKVLCGARVTRGNGYDYARPTTPNITRFLSGSIHGATYVEYIPKVVEFTIYGNTIGINLEDETVKIGDGQHVYSFSGNELMQTSNTPSIQSRYNEIIRDWKNGKETIKLKCAVADYFGNEDTITTRKSKLVESDYYLKPFSSTGGSLTFDFLPDTQTVKITNNSDLNIVANIAISFDESIGTSSPSTEFNSNYNDERLSAHGNVEKTHESIAGIRSSGIVYFAEIRDENTHEYYVAYGTSGRPENELNVFTIPFGLTASASGEFTPSGKPPYTMRGNNGATCTYNPEKNVIQWTHSSLKRDFLYDAYGGNISPQDGKKYSEVIEYQYQGNNFNVSPEKKRISITRKDDNNEDVNMTFHNGDRIVPYLMNSMGEDVPVSLYLDKKTPKQFLVVSQGIIADGQIMQDITAQEITFELPSEEEETTTTTTTTTPQSANIQLIDRRGDWELYAPKSIKR